MGLFDCFGQKKEEKESLHMAKEIAKSVIAAQLNAIRRSDKTERLTMERRPTEGQGISISVNYQGGTFTAPYYAYYIIKSLCTIIDMSFDDMLNHLEVYEELLTEVAEVEHETTTVPKDE